MAENLMNGLHYNDVLELFPEIPDNTPPEGLINVAEGTMQTGSQVNTFRSMGFQSCVGIVVRNEATDKYGLMHAYSSYSPASVEGSDFGRLKEFSGGQAVLVYGSKPPQIDFKDVLAELFRITDVTDVQFENSRYRRTFPFSIVYRPKQNLILVRRTIPYSDILTYGAFKS